MTSDIDYDAVSFAVSSHYRMVVLEALADGAGTPAGLASHTGKDIAHMSRALQELRERALVELLVAEQTKKGRIYGLTERGREVLEGAREIDR